MELSDAAPPVPDFHVFGRLHRSMFRRAVELDIHQLLRIDDSPPQKEPGLRGGSPRPPRL